MSASPSPRIVADHDPVEWCAQGNDCAGYKPGAAMFQRPRGSGVVRDTCGGCVGRLNRAHVEAIREAVRALKAAAALGKSGDEHDAIRQLEALVGPVQTHETVEAVRRALTEKPAAAKGRGDRR